MATAQPGPGPTVGGQPVGTPPSAGSRRLVVSLGGLVAGVALVAALAGLPARATDGARLSGDEPQYLLTATSLGSDGDLDIADEVATASYLPYHEVPLDRQTARRADGRELSPHDPLLPALLAVPMAVGGWAAAKATLAVMAAMTAVVAFGLAVARFGVRPPTAALVVGAAFAGIPLAAYGTQVYPEMPAALALSVAFGAVTAPRGAAAVLGWSRIATASGAVVALPWLSVKYVPVAAVIAAALVWRVRSDRWRLATVAFVGAAAGIGYLAAHQIIYGGWTVYAAGDHFVDDGEFAVVGTQIDPVGRARRLGGLLVDRAFGAAAWSPLWFLLAPAVGRSAARWRTVEGLAVALVAVVWLNATFVALTMHGWWVPGRQIVVGLPLAAVIVAAWVDERGWGRPVAAGLGLLGATNWIWLTLEASTGRRTLIVDFADTAAAAHRALSPILPDGMRAGAVDDLLLAGWTLAMLAAMIHGFRRAASVSSPRKR